MLTTKDRAVARRHRRKRFLDQRVPNDSFWMVTRKRPLAAALIVRIAIPDAFRREISGCSATPARDPGVGCDADAPIAARFIKPRPGRGLRIRFRPRMLRSHSVLYRSGNRELGSEASDRADLLCGDLYFASVCASYPTRTATAPRQAMVAGKSAIAKASLRSPLSLCENLRVASR